MVDLKTDKKFDILVRIEQDGDVVYYRAKDGTLRLNWDYDQRRDLSFEPREEDVAFTFEGMKKVDAVFVTDTANLVRQLLQRGDRIEELERQLSGVKFNHREALRENERIIEKLRDLADELAGDVE